MRIERVWYALPLKLRALFRRGRIEREIAEELQLHLDHLIEEGVASGLSPREARQAALRAMGGVEQHKEEMRDMLGLTWLTDFIDDVRYAARSLRRSLGLTLFIVLTLALGIGMTAAAFSMVDALVFRPYPVPHPDRIVNLSSTSRDDSFGRFSYREYLDVANSTKSYSGVVAHSDVLPFGFSVDAKDTPRVKAGMLVSGNYFRAFGVEPRLGRSFRPDEDQVPGRDAVVVLGHDCFQREFAGDRSIVGRTIRLNGTTFRVIGVAPASFPGMWVFSRPDLYVPLAMAPVFSTTPGKNFFEDRDDRELYLKARLAPGATLAQARNELALVARDFAHEYPALYRDRGAIVRTQLETRTRSDDANWKFGAIFTVLAFTVLLTACMNVAGLLLSRASTRTREIAVRLALGAGRSRLVRMLLAESLLLSLLGGAGGMLVGYVGIRFLQRFSIPTALPLTVPFRMDARVLTLCALLALASAILCGLAPALQSSRADLVTGLKAADIEMRGGRRLWARNVLVVAQVAVSLMLLTAAALMLRGFQRGLTEGTEFTAVARRHVLLASFDPRLMHYDTGRMQRFYEQLAERMRKAPGVAAAGLTLNVPLGLDDFETLTFVPEGFDLPRDRTSLTSTLDVVDPGFFAAMDVPIVRGRGFAATDTPESPRVAVVNEHFAQHYWPQGDAVGRRIWLDHRGGTPVEIVGVAKSVKVSDTAPKPGDFVYVPLAQHPAPRMVMVVRASGEPLSVLPVVRETVRGLDPDLPLLETRTYETIYRYAAIEGPGVAVRLVGTMGAIALFLSLAGLYGLVAYNVSRRTREIGIRMALGAVPADVMRLVMGRGLGLVGIGTVIGLALGLAVERLMDSVLFSSGGVDLLVYAIVVPSMLVVAVLAAYGPARRAARIQPTLALRYE